MLLLLLKRDPTRYLCVCVFQTTHFYSMLSTNLSLSLSLLSLVGWTQLNSSPTLFTVVSSSSSSEGKIMLAWQVCCGSTQWIWNRRRADCLRWARFRCIIRRCMWSVHRNWFGLPNGGNGTVHVYRYRLKKKRPRVCNEEWWTSVFHAPARFCISITHGLLPSEFRLNYLSRY